MQDFSWLYDAFIPSHTSLQETLSQKYKNKKHKQNNLVEDKTKTKKPLRVNSVPKFTNMTVDLGAHITLCLTILNTYSDVCQRTRGWQLAILLSQEYLLYSPNDVLV